MMSGTRRSSPQSPPPITLPARAEASRGAVGVGEERAAEGGGHELRAALGAGVGVVAAHRLVLAVAPLPLAVLVALVGGDVDDHAHARPSRAHGVEHVDRSHHVGLVGLARLGEGAAHQRLGGHVEHHLRARPRERRGDRVGVADVAATLSHARAHLRQLDTATGSVGTPTREAGHLGAQRLQPQRQPGALEAGVAGEQHAPAAPEVGVHGSTGAPACRRSARPTSATAPRPSPTAPPAGCGRAACPSPARSPRGGRQASWPSRASARSGSCSQTVVVAVE